MFLVDEEQGIGDIRNLEKRKYNEPIVNEKPNKRGKSRKTLEVKPDKSPSSFTQKGNDKRQLVNEVSKMFAFDMSELGCTDLVEYKVRTGSIEILHMRLRPIRINNPEKA
ncbi:16057_t:CDS:2 [Dentiscutata heterogama]|uniref:16057_t:CDS:1 n=1 Tax=Dentiscutata heterogama TaxID=1316150 RepID=A0ACA9JXD2_9GLOM|nr:16057_t:CDS:2 [Dentiscutata heterogama]